MNRLPRLIDTLWRIAFSASALAIAVWWTAWEGFVANQRKLAGKEAAPKLVNIDLQPYQTVQACERADIMNIGGFSDSVLNVISAFLADNNQRFVAEVEAIEL